MKIIDMHCDTISRIWESRRSGKAQQLSANSLHMDIQKMKKANYMLQNFAMYIDLKKDLDPFEYVCSLIDIFYEEMEKNKSDIRVIKTYKEIMENDKCEKISALLTIEEGGCCKGKIENLETLYARGARMMTLTWNYPNELANPNLCQDKTDPNGFPLFDGTKGLTKTGFEFAQRMEELGIIIDVSHLSDAGFMDVLETARKPFVASHSNARAVCPNVRNLTDDMIRRLSERGGVMGLNFCPDFLEERPVGEENPGTVAAVVRHAKHIADTGGTEVLGLGGDFDGIPTHRELPGAQSMERLWEALHAAGFSQDQLDKIFYGNVLRVYRDTLE